MSILSDSIDGKKFDVRMVDKNLARGAVQDKEVREYVQSLPDDSENADYTNLEILADPNTKV